MVDQGGSFKMEVELPSPEELPETEGQTDTPYRILVIADYAGAKEGSIGGPLANEVVPITPQTFDEILAVCKPSVDFTLADPTQPGSAMAEVKLSFDSLRAFHPRAIAERHGPTRQLLDLREGIVGRMTGKITAPQLTRKVEELAAADAGLKWASESIRWTPTPPAAPGTAADDLLSQLDLGDDEATSSPPRPKTGVAAVVSAAAGGGTSLSGDEASAMRRTLAEIDRRLNQWINVILHAPQVQSLEAAWRSLAFAVSHIEFRKGIQLSVLHSRKDTLIDRLTELLINPVFDAGADCPDLIAVDMQFGNSAPDMDALDGLAQNATSLPAMALAGVGPEFFGLKNCWQMPTLPNIVGMFD